MTIHFSPATKHFGSLTVRLDPTTVQGSQWTVCYGPSRVPVYFCSTYVRSITVAFQHGAVTEK